MGRVVKLGKYESVQPSTIRNHRGLIIVNMGPSGSGKTTLLETLYLSHDRKDLPDYTPVCVFDIDGKAHVLRDNPLLHIFPVHDWPTLDAHVQEVEKARLHPPFNTIVFDGTALMQTRTQQAAGVYTTDNPMVRQRNYGTANMNMIDIASRAVVLAESSINVIFNIWSVTELDPDTNIAHVIPDLTGALQTKFIGQLDFVVHLECSSPPHPYPPTMRTGGSNKWATKTAVSPDSPLRALPDKILNPNYTHIIDAFRGHPYKP